MAIDTAQKRFSIMLDPGEMGWPPTGTIDADDRAVMLEWYSGIAAGAPSVTPETPIVCVLDPETLRIPVVARDILGVPVHARDRLGIPVFKRDVLRC